MNRSKPPEKVTQTIFFSSTQDSITWRNCQRERCRNYCVFPTKSRAYIYFLDLSPGYCIPNWNIWALASFPFYWRWERDFNAQNVLFITYQLPKRNGCYKNKLLYLFPLSFGVLFSWRMNNVVLVKEIHYKICAARWGCLILKWVKEQGIICIRVSLCHISARI